MESIMPCRRRSGSPRTIATSDLLVHEPHRFACPPGKAQPDRYTRQHRRWRADHWTPRGALYRQIVANLETLAIPRAHVQIRLRDIPQANWGIRGASPHGDIDLGFDVAV
jgi:hypothetical protein